MERIDEKGNHQEGDHIMIEKLITTESLIRGALAISGELEQGLEPIGGGGGIDDITGLLMAALEQIERMKNEETIQH